MEQRDPQTALADQFVVEAPNAGLPWRLMVFSIVLFVFSLFIFFGIKFGYATYLDSRKKNLETQTQALNKKINPDDQTKYVNFYSQTLNLKKVFDRHIFSANVFSFLEKKTAVNVYYTNATFSSEEGTVKIQGIAANSEALIQQLSVFDAASELKSAVLTQMNFAEGGRVNFEVEFVFRDKFFEAPTI